MIYKLDMYKYFSFSWVVLATIAISCSEVHAESFEKLLMPGPVISGHAKYENDCGQCHDVLGQGEQRSLCLDCHKDIKADVNKKSGYHGKYKVASKQNCKACHVEHEGRDADVVKLDEKIFKHQFTDFDLKGAHKVLKCKQCHDANKKFRETPGQCYACHEKNPHKDRLGKKCANCHGQVSWTDMDFDHSKTKFSLTGKHKNSACNSCHINDKYKDTPKSCYACHSVDDVHAGKNGKECNKCHDTNKWGKLNFDHNKKTKFKLYGRHKDIGCKTCHTKNPYKVKVKMDCYSCHKADDSHKGLYDKKCHSCHGFVKWNKPKFEHDRDTKYKLTGKHKKAQCFSCHKSNVYKKRTSSKCVSCHKADDVHKAKVVIDCAECHGTGGWSKKIMFDHDMSAFPLIGLHAITACDDCHLSKAHKNTSMKCSTCHKSDDIHKSKLGSNCETCHNPNGWKYWSFDHTRDTGFKLTGTHKKLHCDDCHDYAVDTIEIEQSCGACHDGDDPHNNQFGRQCEQCHDTESFMHIKMLRR